jgi:hypothetical protein
MPSTNSSSLQPVHWSKDFVEHLRIVHLTLVGISVAILIIVMSTSPYKPAVAAREIHQIVHLKNIWSEEWIRSHSSHAGVAIIPYSRLGELDPAFSLGAGTELIGRLSEERFPNSRMVFPISNLSEHRNARIHYFRLILPKEVFKKSGSDYILARVPEFPSSLKEFEIWWNGLVSPIELYYSSSLAIDTLDYRPPRIGIQFSMFHGSEGVSPQPEIGPEIQLLSMTDLDGIFESRLMATIPRSSKTMFTEYQIDVRGLEQDKLGQENLATFFGNWKVGEYKKSFSDLEKAAHDFDGLDFDDIEKILDANATKGGEVFEALGIKIPVDQVTIWGTVILLGVQIYLLLFLRQLNGRLGPADAGWDVPWVGMDQTKFAQCVLFLTVVVLPCLATGVLGGRAILLMATDYRDNPGHFWSLPPLRQWNPSVPAKIILIVAAFAAAIVLAIQSWKYRPRMTQEPSCPSQLFE